MYANIVLAKMKCPKCKFVNLIGDIDNDAFNKCEGDTIPFLIKGVKEVIS
jgi:hypothetical protein